MPITTNQTKCLSALWATWQRVTESLGRDVDSFFALTLSEAKSHDRMRPHGIRRGISIDNEARYFALKRIAEFTIEQRAEPPLAHYWHWQTSIYGAYALTVDEVTGPVVRKWSEDNRDALTELLTWDYAELIK